MQLSGPRSRLSEPSALGPVQRPPDRRLRQTEYTRYCRHGFPPVQSGGHIVVSRTWVGVRGARVRAVWKRSACYHHVLFVCIYGLLYRESGAPRAQAKEGALVRRSRRQLRGARGVYARAAGTHTRRKGERRGDKYVHIQPRQSRARPAAAAPTRRRVPSLLLLGVRLGRRLWLLLAVFKQRGELAAHGGGEQRREDAGRHQVQQRRLRRVEEVHHADGESEPGDVGGEVCVKVGLRGEGELGVEAEHHRDKDAWDDDVAEAEHREGHGRHAESLGEHDLDGRVEPLGDRDHHLGAEDPKDVVHEEAGEQRAADGVRAEREHLDSLDREGAAEQVVEVPGFCDGIRGRGGGAAERERDVEHAEGEGDLVVLGGGGPPDLPVEVDLVLTQRAARVQQARDGWSSGAKDTKCAEAGKVDRDEEVDVLLFDELDDEVEGEEGTRADQRELHGVLLGHHLHVRLARRLLRLKQCPLAANPDEQRAEDEQVEVRVYQDEVWNDEHRNDEQIRSPEASNLCVRRGDGLGDGLGCHRGRRQGA
mmetsp:Transcript_15733/g.46570  ORF Transcript_15733/g.46570 Transcript_15733/m.46570 type:complete len:536 (+) Transcript_15733:595-2202(+)